MARIRQGRTDLVLTNGARGLDVNNDAKLHVDEIVVGVSKECRPLMRSGPLRRGIGRRYELRDHVAGGAPRRIIESRQILLHGATGPLGITIPAPILALDRALLVGIGLNQARIDGEAFTADQTGHDARLDDPLENATKNFAIAKALVAGARERRMIRQVSSIQLEPAIGEVHLHFTTDQSLRTDRKRHIPRSASGSSVPDRSTVDQW